MRYRKSQGAPPPITRRVFVGAAMTVGGSLVLGVNLQAQEGGESRATPAATTPRLPSAFVQIGEDDSITIITPAVEMGQGGHTAMPMLVMEELGGDWDRVRVADAAAAAVYNNPLFGMQATVGSFSVRGWYRELRRIGAVAREMLVQAAAEDWSVPIRECTAGNSRIVHGPTGRSRSFGSVAARAATLPIPQEPPLKPRSDFRVIGTSPPRGDIPAKVNGSACFGIDVKLPGMLYAAVKSSPTLGGTLASFNDAAAKPMPGYHCTAALHDGVIVVARSYWQAKKALDQVSTVYDQGALAGWDSAKVSLTLRQGFNEIGKIARHDGDVAAALAAAATVMEAQYEAPYLAHACMEPMNCTARVDAAGCEVWCGTQSPQAARAAAATALGIPRERVKVNTTYLGGGFGRRGQADYVAQAVIAARAAGRPVKLIWSREEDIQHDYYRPAAAIRFRAGLSAKGELTALDCSVVTAASSAFERPNLPPTYTGGVSDTNYSIPNLRVCGVNKDIGVRFGFWRSVNDSHNPFMLEGFIDEIAARTKKDPYQFRRLLLQHAAAQRQLAVLDLIADKAHWEQRRPGHFLGIAAFESFGSYIGSVADITVKDNKVSLHRVIVAIDCGVAIHPDNIKAQLEGGMVYGLSAVLRGEITLDNGAVRQSNFHDYPMLLMSEMPVVECFVVPSAAPPGGVGEPGTGPIGPALANAVYAATGRRLRSLPLSKHNLTVSAVRVS
ncbi:MAG TPA: molybdopterin cofactor-binding domain-containing protein [Steroidobacteraceae bacterium]|jgi:isoquinoline 1-oxidoreductase beta subunit|nr:molybdopterin cofactor-binding domain-containing protein [Steroidobacteraceae bacterium]